MIHDAHPERNRAGIALVVVLVFLVLTTVLVVGFFSTATSELTAAKSYADGVTVRQLSDSAVSVVMGQIRQASTQAHGAWTSQPGMIRVFCDKDGPSSNPYAYYKLYSSNNLIVSGEDLQSYSPSAEIPVGANGWNHQRALFTDLNEPVNSVTPGAQTSQTTKRFPILDPSLDKIIEGFSVSAPRGDDSGSKAPMPVRWLYVLEDGTLTAPDHAENNGRTAVWSGGVSGTGNQSPSADDPVVGRIAFWADDDTCKVNVNTAGGFTDNGIPAGYDQSTYAGSYWDTPRVTTMFDRGNMNTSTGVFTPGQAGLCFCQPLRNEFQRYAGHPSTTSMGLVFGNLFSSEQIYALAPRLVGGGSAGGTKQVLSISGQPLIPKTDRLYASVDEFLFSPDSDSAGKRIPNETMLQKEVPAVSGRPAAKIPPQLIEELRFFLTAHSRAPELNLFGRPRVTLWPINANSQLLNASDQLIAFCSSLGPSTDRRTFFFSRQDPYSPTTDAKLLRNPLLYGYLQSLTGQSVPGFGRGFDSKYSADDRNQILSEMFDYIRCVNLRDSTHDLAIEATYPSSQWQARTDAYKFAPRGIVVPIRFVNGGVTNYGFGRFPTISEAALVFYHAGYVSANPDPITHAPFVYYDRTQKAANGVSANYVRAFLVLETHNPMQGYAPTNAPISADVSANNILVHELVGLDQLAIQTPSMPAFVPLGMPGVGANPITLCSGNTWNGQNSGGEEGFMHTLWPKCARYNGDPGGGVIPAKQGYYPFQSPGPGVLIPASDTVFNFSGGTVTLNIKFGSNLVRTQTLNFQSSTNWPIPTDDIWNDHGGFLHSKVVAPTPGETWNTLDVYSQFSFPNRLVWAIQHSYDPWLVVNGGDGLYYGNRWRQILQPGDTVRSLLFQNPGDLRVACLVDSGSTSGAFAPHANYATGARQGQTLRCANGAVYYANGTSVNGASYSSTATKFGNLVALPANLAYPASIAAKLPPTVLGATMAGSGLPADFDTGIGNLADGAFTGKADEGNLAWRYWDTNHGIWVYVYPYFTWDYQETFDTFFTPNRQVPSAVAFGSLLAGRKKHWQTLCFCPNPAAADAHPGLASPKDHLFLDLFTMPIVEPYAISEPFSTAGKINLNYPVMPFTYIVRTTGLRAALSPVRVSAIPAADVAVYKTPPSIAGTKNYRIPLDRDQTIAGIDGWLTGGGAKPPDVFRSASQICERFLYPLSPYSSVVSAAKVNYSPGEQPVRKFWLNAALTGDNMREKPYSDLYPRLTTKSNTYTVHVRVQALRSGVSPGAAAAAAATGSASPYLRWTETNDTVFAEYRGYSIIERYIDPQDRRFNHSNQDTQSRGDFIDVDAASLESAFRFRVVESKQFNP